jgi:hypothetical protein
MCGGPVHSGVENFGVVSSWRLSRSRSDPGPSRRGGQLTRGRAGLGGASDGSGLTGRCRIQAAR